MAVVGSILLSPSKRDRPDLSEKNPMVYEATVAQTVIRQSGEISMMMEHDIVVAVCHLA